MGRLIPKRVGNSIRSNAFFNTVICAQNVSRSPLYRINDTRKFCPSNAKRLPRSAPARYSGNISGPSEVAHAGKIDCGGHRNGHRHPRNTWPRPGAG
jgi:hypothetical protein